MMKRFFAVLLLMCACGAMIVSGGEEKKKEAPEQSSPPLRTIDELRQAAFERMDKDAIFYSKEERVEIEKLYQFWKTRKGKERQAIAITLLRRFPKANRTGCTLYLLALDNARQKRIDLLKQVIQNHSDCWFGNGMQVGATARYHLIRILMETGKQEEAEQYREELNTLFPDAVDGIGKRFSELLKD